MSAFRHIQIEHVGDMTVAGFVESALIDEPLVTEWGNELFKLVDTDRRVQLVIDFTGVEFFGSSALAKLLTLDKKIKAVSGKLRLCGMRNSIQEIFWITRLNRILEIRETRAEALADWPKPVPA